MLEFKQRSGPTRVQLMQLFVLFIVWHLPFLAGTTPYVLVLALMGITLLLFLYDPENILKLAVMLASFAVMLTLVDALIRPVLVARSYRSSHNALLYTTPRYGTFNLYEPSRTVVGQYENDGEIITTTFHTDVYGFRNEAAPGEEPLDYIFLGDSFTAGVGVDQDETFVSRFSQMQKARVYNMGVARTSPPSQYLILRDMLPQLPTDEQTKLIWVLFTGNDIHEPGATQHPGQALSDVAVLPPHRQLWVRYQQLRAYSPLGNYINKLPTRGFEPFFMAQLENGEETLIYRFYYYHNQQTPDMLVDQGLTVRFEEAVAATAQLAEENNLCLMIVTLPSKEHVYGTLSPQLSPLDEIERPGTDVLIEQTSSQYGIPYFSLHQMLRYNAETLLRANNQLLWLEHDPTHPNALGHQLIAEAIGDASREACARQVVHKMRD